MSTLKTRRKLSLLAAGKPSPSPTRDLYRKTLKKKRLKVVTQQRRRSRMTVQTTPRPLALDDQSLDQLLDLVHVQVPIELRAAFLLLVTSELSVLPNYTIADMERVLHQVISRMRLASAKGHKDSSDAKQELRRA
jgi:hypothetical protein